MPIDDSPTKAIPPFDPDRDPDTSSRTTETSRRPAPDSEAPAVNRGQEPTLLEYALTLWRRRKLLATCVLAGVVLAVAAHLILPKDYAAAALIVPPQTNAASEALARLGRLPASLSLGEALGLPSFPDRCIDLLKSRKIADAVIDRCGLEERYGLGSRAATRAKLAGCSVFEITRGNLVKITVTDRDAGAAANIANAYVAALDRLDRELSNGEANRQRIALRVVDEAVAPDRPAGPGGMTKVIIGLGIGFIVGLVLVWLLEPARGDTCDPLP